MFDTDTAAEDRSPAVMGVDAQAPPWRLVELRPLPGYRLFQRFVDGTQGVTEMQELIFSDHAGVFASLRDAKQFAEVSIDAAFGSVCWANGRDIAPDATYEYLRRDGIQVLR